MKRRVGLPCVNRKTRWWLCGDRLQLNARKDFQIIPYPKNENG